MTVDLMKQLRDARGWSQQDLADWLNTSLARKYDRHRISRWETAGERVPQDVEDLVRQELGHSHPPRPDRPARIIGFANFKGGVGKTTTAVNVAAHLAEIGQRVLLVDCDPQYNATKILFAIEAQDEIFRRGATLLNAIEEDRPLADVITPAWGIDVIPSHIKLMRLEARNEAGAEYIFREKLEPLLRRYDWIILDAPPNPGKLTAMVLTAAHGLVIPVRTEPLDHSGIELILDEIRQVQRRLNPALKLLGVLPNHFDARKTVDQLLLDTIRARDPRDFTVYEPIPYDSCFGKASMLNEPVVRTSRRSNGAKALMALSRRLLQEVGDGR
ncbi:MAG TPA: AAA family ATPase [Azospirillaceae bacterium]|nr:AAA family ATPase [Azospirillaceae bacterium]